MKTSVVICTYNGSKFIATQLKSIINQTRCIDELVLCDDNSSDGTLAIVNDILQNVSFKVNILRNAVNIGALLSFEKCIKASTGDIIFLSDQDDMWFSDKVEKIYNFFQRDSSALAVFTDGKLMDEENSLLGSSLWAKWNFVEQRQKNWLDNGYVFSELLHNRNVITGATMAFKKELIPAIIPFQLPFTYWHDSWIGIVAAGLGGLRFLEEPLIAYRLHSAQQVGVSSGASDKKFNYISKEAYFEVLKTKFPVYEFLIYPKKKSFVQRVVNKIKSRL